MNGMARLAYKLCSPYTSSTDAGAFCLTSVFLHGDQRVSGNMPSPVPGFTENGIRTFQTLHGPAIVGLAAVAVELKLPFLVFYHFPSFIALLFFCHCDQRMLQGWLLFSHRSTFVFWSCKYVLTSFSQIRLTLVSPVRRFSRLCSSLLRPFIWLLWYSTISTLAASCLGRRTDPCIICFYIFCTAGRSSSPLLFCFKGQLEVLLASGWWV